MKIEKGHCYICGTALLAYCSCCGYITPLAKMRSGYLELPKQHMASVMVCADCEQGIDTQACEKMLTNIQEGGELPGVTQVFRYVGFVEHCRERGIEGNINPSWELALRD